MSDSENPQDDAAMSPASTGSLAWIPVTERLPNEYETVLVATDGGVSAGEVRFPDSECDMDEAWWMVFKDRRDRTISWAGLVRLSDVTHWMPLPPLPNMGSDGPNMGSELGSK